MSNSGWKMMELVLIRFISVAIYIKQKFLQSTTTIMLSQLKFTDRPLKNSWKHIKFFAISRLHYCLLLTDWNVKCNSIEMGSTLYNVSLSMTFLPLQFAIRLKRKRDQFLLNWHQNIKLNSCPPLSVVVYSQFQIRRNLSNKLHLP